jgi:hypothetical protein
MKQQIASPVNAAHIQRTILRQELPLALQLALASLAGRTAAM